MINWWYLWQACAVANVTTMLYLDLIAVQRGYYKASLHHAILKYACGILLGPVWSVLLAAAFIF